MKQLTRELKSVLTTGYNVENNEYRINYWYLTYSNDIACNVYDWDNLLVKIKYWNKKDVNNYIRYTEDKNIKNLIKRAWIKYA